MKKQVAKMSRTLKTVKSQAQYARDDVHDCLRNTNAGAMAVSEFGDAVTHTRGYRYYDGTSTSYTTALDIDMSSTPGAFLQKVYRGCATR